jgi:hypothetical protein
MLCLLNFCVPVALDNFGLLLVKLRKFRACSFLDTDQFVELGMKRQIIPAIGPLNEQRHHEDRERGDRVPLERGRAEGEPKRCVDNDEKKGGRVSRRLPDSGGPVMLTGFFFRHAYFIFTFGSRSQTRKSPSFPTKPAA